MIKKKKTISPKLSEKIMDPIQILSSFVYLHSLDLGLFKRLPLLLVKEKYLSLLVNYKHLNGFYWVMK